MSERRLTRETCHRGQLVTVTERASGNTWTGSLVGWGVQLVDLQLDEESKLRNGMSWKRKSFWVGGVTVTSR